MAKLPWGAKLGIGAALSLVGIGAGIAGTVFANSGCKDKWGDFGVDAAVGAAKAADQAAERANASANYVAQQMAGAGNFKEI